VSPSTTELTAPRIVNEPDGAAEPDEPTAQASTSTQRNVVSGLGGRIDNW
jgi:hypothetical protein